MIAVITWVQIIGNRLIYKKLFNKRCKYLISYGHRVQHFNQVHNQ